MKTAREAAAAARAWLAAPDEKLLAQLNAYAGEPGPVIELLKPRRPRAVDRGLHHNRPFSTEHLHRKHPEDRMTVFVPKSYDPAKPCGLMLMLHGGGRGMARTSGDKLFDPVAGIADLFMESGFILCSPCCPYSPVSWNGWNVPEADELIADVIEEMEHLYNIDPDRVFLAGHSMGGIGANHLAHRLGDRFAGVMAAASAWDIAYWPALMGTTFWISQGINDAVMYRRRHGTDIEFARLAKARLEQAGVDVVYREHSGGHAWADARPTIKEWLAWAAGARRDPYYPRVVAVSPRGLTPWMDWRRHKVSPAAYQNQMDFRDLPPAPHARWVTLNGIGPETIIYDTLRMTDCRDAEEADWNAFALTLGRKHVPGGVAEVVRGSVGVIEVAPKNVTGLTLWLHPRMVNLNRVEVRVRGVRRHNGPVKPGLGTLVASYRRRRDWGMLYPASVTIEGDASWGSGDQLKIQV